MRETDVSCVAAIDGPTRVCEAQLRDELGRSWSRTWVAREDGEGVVAFLLAWHVADEVHVLNVTTRADRRRRGIARTLLQAALAYGSAEHARQVLLEVRRSNHAAIALYRSVGFFAMGLRRRYYPDDEDAVEMVVLYDRDTGAVVSHEDELRIDANP